MLTIVKWVIWNLFLAAIPVVLAYIIYKIADKPKRSIINKIILAIVGMIWLAFLPNTCYLITEWRHFLYDLDSSNLYLQSQLSKESLIKLMLFTAFYFFYSGIGMVAFTLAIRQIHRLFKKNNVSTLLPSVILFLLLSIGVYLGLILRYNSWNLINRPLEIFSSVAVIASKPFLPAFIIVFAGFLWLSYIAIDIWIDGFIARRRSTSNKV